MTLKILILNMRCLKQNYDQDRQILKTYIWTIMTGLERGVSCSHTHKHQKQWILFLEKIYFWSENPN